MIPHLAQLQTIAQAQPYPLLFATVSGSHLYGFPSADSDYDLRGVHLLPLQDLVGLSTGPETLEISADREGLELDLVTHEAKKFLGLMLKRNGYVLEQLYSPLVVQARPEHEMLKAIAPRCITRHHAHHYLGFAQTQWRLFAKEHPPRVKPLLYTYRVLLTGIHLMESGKIESNLLKLNTAFKLPYVADLVAQKIAGAETSVLSSADVEFHEQEYQRLLQQLEEARDRSTLPPTATAQAELHALLLKLRLGESNRSD